jgi:hypothetical protein
MYSESMFHTTMCPSYVPAATEFGAQNAMH